MSAVLATVPTSMSLGTSLDRTVPLSQTSGHCMGRRPTHFQLPDLLPSALLEGTALNWPCNSPMHPLQHTITGESMDWVKSLGAMSDKKLSKFAKYNIMILVAYSYRRAGHDHFRLCADFMHLFWIIDDITDALSSEEVQQEIVNVKRVLQNPNKMSSEPSVLENSCRLFWKHVVEWLHPPRATKRRWLRDFTQYLDSLPEEALDRETGRLRDLTEHFELRRRTGGLLPSFDFIYMPFELPDEIAEHEVVHRMTQIVGDLVIIANDIYSYNVEQARGQKSVAHNIIDVVLRERQGGLQETFDIIGAHYRDLFIDLVADYHNLPVFNNAEHDRIVREYALGLLDWVEGNVQFSLASERYFPGQGGSQGVQRQRWVELLPVEGENLYEL